MFGVIRDGAQVLPTLDIVKVVVVITALVVTHWMHRSMPVEAAAERLPAWAHGLVWGGMLVLLGLNPGVGQCLHLLPVLSARCPRGAWPPRGLWRW